MGVPPTKTLLWDLGSVLQWLPAYQGRAAGLRQCTAARGRGGGGGWTFCIIVDIFA